MNTNIINLDCSEWGKEDWLDAYNQYCQHNTYGPKTKKEYYDFVCERHKRFKLTEEPLSPELAHTWSVGRRNARLWAKKHGCDRNGRSIWLSKQQREDAEAKELAEHAENIAIEAINRLDYLVEVAKKRKGN